MLQDNHTQTRKKGARPEPTGAPPADAKGLPLFRPEVTRRGHLGLYGRPIWRIPFGPRSLAFVGFALALPFILLVLFLPLPELVSLQGVLVPAGGLTELKAPKTGKVASVQVREGELVAKDQALATIDTEIIYDNSSQAAVAVAVADSKIKAQRAVTRAAIQDIEIRIRGLRAQERDTRTGIALTRTRLERQRAIIRLSEMSLARGRDLAGRGFLSAMEVEERERNLLLAQQEETDIHGRILSAERELRTAQEQRAALEAEYARARLGATSAEGEHVLNVYAADRTRYATLRSPLAARVGTVLVRPGRYVEGGQSVLVLVPEPPRWEAEFTVGARQIPLLRVRAPVSLVGATTMDGVSRAKGFIASLAPAPAAEARRGEERRYRVTVAVRPSAGFPLVAGSPVRALVTTSRRPLVQRLFR